MIEYFKFLAEDKKSLPYWFFLFVFSIIFSWPLLIISIVIFFGFYSTSYYHYKSFFSNFKINNNNNSYKEGIVETMVFQKSYRVSTPISGANINISIPPLKFKQHYILTSLFIFILLEKREFGLFKAYGKTLIIPFEKSFKFKYKNSSLVYLNNIIEVNNNDIIIFLKNKKIDIDKIVLVNFAELINNYRIQPR